MDNTQHFTALLEKIKHDHNLDLSEYKFSTIRRRVNRRLSVTKIPSYRDYTLFLDEKPDEYQQLIESLTINVSNFFRDPPMFEILASRIWPRLLESKRQKGSFSIRVWSAGCSGGQEAYSLAILLAEQLKDEASRWDILIFASDIDQNSLLKGKNGVYSEEDVREVKKGILDKYFIPYQTHVHNPPQDTVCKSSEVFRITNRFKRWIHFIYHDLASDKSITPPASIITNLDMIVCRNVLIYFTNPLQEKILNKFFFALEEDGCLVLGKNERIGNNLAHQWKEIKERFKIYQKQSGEQLQK